MRVFTICAVLVCLVIPRAAAAQPESGNVVHTRHQHPHTHKHATDDTPSRFFTDRDTQVGLPLPKEDGVFSFVVFGDRTGGPDAGINVLADAVRDVNLLGPDLVMTVGDLIQGYSETGEWMDQMEEYKGVMGNLVCPWFPVAGNHDVYWRDQGLGGIKPENEHEGRYELHFGPLWYSFSHKNAHFIVLYSDEGDPETGEMTFRKPAAQTMSDAQRAFLGAALERAQGADHVFVFVHHPRWLGGNYGDDWDSVHEMLVDAGNVTAVFAGHIHMMRSDPRDGIEYVTLATVGGHQGGSVPDAGFLHHYNIVTVREDHAAMTAYPVGAALDPRDITGELAIAAHELSSLAPRVHDPIPIDAHGSADKRVRITVSNPSAYPIEYTLVPHAHDARWRFSPDHLHGSLTPGSAQNVEVFAKRDGAGEDMYIAAPELLVSRELLTDTFRYAIPEHRVPLMVRPTIDAPGVPETERVFETDARSSARVASGDLIVPIGPLTLECWFNADSFSDRVGLVAKTENSDYGIFVNDGIPEFSIFLVDRYTTVASGTKVEPGAWHHVAGVFDGREVRLYLDGELVGSQRARGERRLNTLPLIIGADVNGDGDPVSPFHGRIDDVHVSRVARYDTSFTPTRRPDHDKYSALLLHMDARIGPWLYDATGNAHAWISDQRSVIVED